MKRMAAVLILVALNTGAAGAWVRVGGNSNAVCYADLASITKKGHIATMTSLLNFTSAQTAGSIGGKPYHSEKDQREYDCVNERHRLMRFSLRAGAMYGGAVVRSQSDAGEWSAVTPGSLGEALWKFACGRK